LIAIIAMGLIYQPATTTEEGLVTAANNNRIVARTETYFNSYPATGAGTTGSPWGGFATGIASGTAMRMASGVYATNGALDLRDIEKLDLEGVGGQVILKNTSSGATAAVVDLQNTQHRLWSDIGGMMLDGGGHASRGIHGTRFSFSELGPISGGHFAAGAWLIEVTDTGGATYRHINTHSVVAADPTDDDYAGLAPPANGMHLSRARTTTGSWIATCKGRTVPRA
jgi:hypothetical protein